MRVKTLILSDTHLGYKLSNDAEILKILKETEFEKLILVGDIIDIKRFKKNHYWNENQNKIIQKILKYSRDRQVIYVWGNHDKLEIYGEHFGNIFICREYPHVLSNGETLLCVHGDLFEAREKRVKFLNKIGGWVYDIVSEIDFILNTNFVKWSKNKLQGVKDYVTVFEEDAQKYAESKGFSGIICGHIHCPNVDVRKSEKFSEFLYCNSGDFVHNCSYLIEDHDGNIKLIKNK